MTGGGSAMDRPKIPLLAKVKIMRKPNQNFPIERCFLNLLRKSVDWGQVWTNQPQKNPQHFQNYSKLASFF